MEKQKKSILVLVILMTLMAMAAFVPGLVSAGDLEPPSSAVDGNGDPVSTTMTPPGWSKKLPDAERFELVLDGAGVLDKETGLTWDAVVDLPGGLAQQWADAIAYCNNKTDGNRKGWRLPTVEELNSLIDPTGSYLSLPNGYENYFSGVKAGSYWSSTTSVSNPSNVWRVQIADGVAHDDHPKTYYYYFWCVRGGQGHDAY